MHSTLTIKPLMIVMFSITFLVSACEQLDDKTVDAALSPAPNIVVIVADDQGYADVSYKNLADDVNTPNIDKLAAIGTDFTQAYVPSPICSTSRTSLITGSYSQRLGMYWYGGKGLENPEFQTLAEKLKEANYTTGYIGKYHYGNSKKSIDRNFPLHHGFDYFYGFEGGRKHYLIHNDAKEKAFNKTRNSLKAKGESLTMGSVWVNHKKVKQNGFSTELIEKQATEFIRNNQSSPFYLQVSFNALHNFTHQLPDEYLAKHKLPKRMDWEPNNESFRQWYVAARAPNNEYGREYYLGQLYYLDQAIGEIVNELEKNNLLENTIIVYLSDNGGSTPIYANNGRFRGSKYTLYEGGIRVPMIVYIPEEFRHNTTMNRRIDDVVSTMDIYPTLLQAAGLQAPENIDGESLVELMLNNSPMSREALVWDTGHEIAVRKGRWKYHAVYDDYYAEKQMVDLELGEFLYDVESDPEESINLIEQYPDIVVTLKSIHQQWSLRNKHRPSREPKKARNL
ncbi:sulfatase family protein [Aliiglaciecola lipolytica]|uniref:Sulfatase N-terminal domain-containing protein n=1 Tax=Aliiglaciecola lipolytica E3 TaxID=1127673 RepID=K6YEC0_9ALTE|nr:sulfatase-like hydrolase/transferase [Aliiglaciecola lipolytica]GAC16517.1 hypothetical protein GLIP_3906 [Aliiglaciecola lipolytica E3]